MHLREILDHKREEIRALKLPRAERHGPVRDPVARLRHAPFIAEIKRASPSRGPINTNDDVLERARAYERGGAGAVSVVTDRRFFQGGYDRLRDVASSVSLPILCKDFILSEIQIDTAYLHGADFILLIVRILNVREIRILSRRARRYGLKVLYEIHGPDELRLLRGLDPEMVGVNARNLDTFTLDRDTALRTIASLPRDFMIVAESGIETARDIVDYQSAGADAFLVGSALMTAGDPAGLLGEFRRSLAGPCL